MGPMRLGRLPETRTWQQVVDLIVGGADVEKIAYATERAAEKALSKARNDEGFRDAVYLFNSLLLPQSQTPKFIYQKSVCHFPRMRCLLILSRPCRNRWINDLIDWADPPTLERWHNEH